MHKVSVTTFHSVVFSMMISMSSVVVVDQLLMVLDLQELDHGPQAKCQYHHHPPTVSSFLGERLYSAGDVFPAG